MGLKRSMLNLITGMAVTGIVLSGNLTCQAAGASEGPNRTKSQACEVVSIDENGEITITIERQALQRLLAQKRAAMEQYRLAVSTGTTASTASKGVTSGETEKVGDYSYTKMDVTMYAKSSVNVRSIPDTTGDKIGKLASGDAVKVTGQCVETGWYRIDLGNGKIGYVSSDYIVAEKKTGTTSTATGGSTANGGSGSTTTASGSSTVNATDSGTMSDFLSYLNQQRAAMGLSEISWDSSLAAEAQKRAEEVVSNFNHDGFGGGTYLENLYKGGTNSAADVYSAWYNSPGHRAAMLNADATKAGVAFVCVDGYYYVVLVEKTEAKVMSADEWNEYKDAAVVNGDLQHYEIDDGGSISEVYGNGIEISTDAEGDAAANELLRQLGLL